MSPGMFVLGSQFRRPKHSLRDTSRASARSRVDLSALPDTSATLQGVCEVSISPQRPRRGLGAFPEAIIRLRWPAGSVGDRVSARPALGDRIRPSQPHTWSWETAETLTTAASRRRVPVGSRRDLQCCCRRCQWLTVDQTVDGYFRSILTVCGQWLLLAIQSHTIGRGRDQQHNAMADSCIHFGNRPARRHTVEIASARGRVSPHWKP